MSSTIFLQDLRDVYHNSRMLLSLPGCNLCNLPAERRDKQNLKEPAHREMHIDEQPRRKRVRIQAAKISAP